MRVNITGNNTLAFCLFNLESLSSHSDLVWMQGCLTLNGMAMRILAIQLVIKARYSVLKISRQACTTLAHVLKPFS